MTLGQAADELNVFYLDLLKALYDAGIRDTTDAEPDDPISPDEIDTLKYEGHVHPMDVSSKTFNPALYVLQEDIRRKYTQWFIDWMQKNRLLYPRLLHSFRYRFIKEGITEPASYEDFCSALIAYYDGDHQKMNNAFSFTLRFDLFKHYTDFTDLGRLYPIIHQTDGYNDLINIIPPFSPRGDLSLPGDIDQQEVFRTKNGKPRKMTKQWAFVYAFREITKTFNLPKNKLITQFFDEIGKEKGFDGHAVYQKYLKMKTEEGLKKAMKLKGAAEYVDLAIRLLEAEGDEVAAQYGRLQYENTFKK